MRDPKRIPETLKQLQAFWETVPDWRLGQLVCNVGRGLGHYDPFYIEDEEFVQWLKSEAKKEQ